MVRKGAHCPLHVAGYCCLKYNLMFLMHFNRDRALRTGEAAISFRIVEQNISEIREPLRWRRSNECTVEFLVS